MLLNTIVTRISSRLDRTARRRRGGGGDGQAIILIATECLARLQVFLHDLLRVLLSWQRTTPRPAVHQARPSPADIHYTRKKSVTAEFDIIGNAFSVE